MELTWPQFRELPHVQILSESEQQSQYYFYLDNLANVIINLRRAGGGKPRSDGDSPDHEYLITEDGLYILTEDGQKIRVS